jgi:hypothetical protein
MTDLDTRAERVRAIVTSLHGKVLDRQDDVMTVEVPADIMGGFTTLAGMGGFSAILQKQSTKMAPRRIVNISGQVVVCDEMVTTAFYSFKVSLQPHHVAVEAKPHAGATAITAPTPPFGG